MSKGKSVWLDQDLLAWIEKFRVGDESHNSVLKRKIKELEYQVKVLREGKK